MVDSEDTEARVDAQAAVDALFGAGRARVVDAVSSTRVTEREVLLVNGVAVRLVGDDGAALKDALLAGRLPDEGLLSRVLASVLGGTGAWRGASAGGTPSTLTMHSSLSLTSSVSTSDTVTLCHNGRVIDSRSVNSTRHAQVSGATTTHTQALPPNCSSIFAQTSSTSAEEPPNSTTTNASATSASTSTYTTTATTTTTSTPSSAPIHTSTSSESTSTAPHAPPPTPTADASADGVKSGTSGEPSSPKWCGMGGAWACEDSGGVQYRSYSGRTAMNSDLVEALARTGLVDLRPQPSSPPKSSPAQQQRPTIFGTLADGGKGATRDHKVGLPQGARTRSSHEHETADGEHQSAPDHEHALVYEDGVLVAGSLQALVQHAVPTGTYYPDTAYLFAFLLSARLFIKPHELLQQICAVGFAQQGITNSHDAASVKNEQLSSFVRHMVQLLAEWSETFPYDFRDDRLMAGVRSLTHRCIALRPDLRRDVTQVLHNLLNKLTHLERFEESAAKLTAPPPADLIPQPSDISEICASPLVMAQQLTHIELERLSFIGPEEFVQAFAKDNLDTSYKDLKRTCNLEAYIQWFNRLSYLVATHACSHVKRKVRVRLIEWWVEVARECFNIGNFNSLMGVIAGLNMAPVSRMKKTWSKVQSAKFSVLEHQMDPSSNFSSYRSTLKAAMWRSAGALDDRQKIVIPFFSLLVKDLYFLNEGCANRLPNGHINFDKFWQLAKQVTEFLAWKQVSCPFTRHPEVITYLLTTQILSETGLALASFECESPENHYEKERYKALKSALNPTT